jgi:hypothetical protein
MGICAKKSYIRRLRYANLKIIFAPRSLSGVASIGVTWSHHSWKMMPSFQFIVKLIVAASFEIRIVRDITKKKQHIAWNVLRELTSSTNASVVDALLSLTISETGSVGATLATKVA